VDYQLQSAAVWHKTELHGDPLCHHFWSLIFRNKDEPRQGKAPCAAHDKRHQPIDSIFIG